MTIKEKIALASTINQLVLFKESMFYKLYNKHNLFFVAHTKPFKVSINYVKSVKQEVFNVGFRLTAFNTIAKTEKFIPAKEWNRTIKEKMIALGAKIKLFEIV
jgi:hypothetical protein